MVSPVASLDKNKITKFGEWFRLVLQVVPDAQIYLFGSRANGNPTDESDWDILILTSQKVDKHLKNDIHEKIFPLSVEIASFIHTVITQKEDWQNNPSWYSLNKTFYTGKVVQ